MGLNENTCTVQMNLSSAAKFCALPLKPLKTRLSVYGISYTRLLLKVEALPAGARGGGGEVSVPLHPENNAQVSLAPFQYFLTLPKIILLLLQKILKVTQLLHSTLNIQACSRNIARPVNAGR